MRLLILICFTVQNASAENFDSESFKESAKEERDKLSASLKSIVQSESIYEQCYGHFRNQTNLILAETAKEVEAYLEKLENAKTYINLAMGYLSIVPGAGTWHRLATAVVDQLKKLKGYAASGYQLNTKEVVLSKYEEGKIEVTLCFGTIYIPIESKIKV